MRAARLFLPLLGLAGLVLGACQQNLSPPKFENGWLGYSSDHADVDAVCDGTPIRLTGDQTDGTLKGACTNVQLTGSHNDVDVAMAPGGQFEITGTSNDVWWHLARPGTPPVLINRGKQDAFHASR